MNVYVKDSQISADLSTLSATGKAQKGKKFFVVEAWLMLTNYQ
jgi:hypothetical protein